MKMHLLPILLAAATVSLAWDPNPETVTGYELRQGKAPGLYDTTNQLGNVTTATVDGLEASQTYYFVVAAQNEAGVGQPSAEITYTVSGPATLPIHRLQLWLRGDAGIELAGEGITRWRDQSGNARDAGQGTGFMMPRRGTNTAATVFFDGINDFMALPLPILNATGLTVIAVSANSIYQGPGNAGPERAVIYWPSTTSQPGASLAVFQNFISFGFGDGFQMTSARPEPIGPVLTMTTAIKDGRVDRLYIDGKLVRVEGSRSPMVVAVSDVATLGRGYGNNTFWSGQLAELLVYDRVLEEAERAVVEGYLRNRYLTGAATADAPTWTQARSLSLETATAGGAIWYALGGEEPTNGPPSQLYAIPFQVERGEMVKAQTFKDGISASRVTVIVVP